MYTSFFLFIYLYIFIYIYFYLFLLIFSFSQYSDFMMLCPLFRRPLGVMSMYCLLSYNKKN